MKGGRLSRHIQPARAIHIVTYDANRAPHEELKGYPQLMYRNRWLHNLPDCTTFAEAVDMLHKWHAWDDAPASVKAHLTHADPTAETVKADEFEQWDYRIFGIMPRHLAALPTAGNKAAELGFAPHTISTWMQAEASHASPVVACIASSIERDGVPFEPPCALLTTGELLVTVGAETGIGGRNQEYALAAASKIAGSENIVFGAVDTDGTDGPGGFVENDLGISCLAGGIVDGHTLSEARATGVDIAAALQQHNTSPALWQLGCGIAATQNISLTDLGVTLILGRSNRPIQF
jgi:glycerate-2-kinase